MRIVHTTEVINNLLYTCFELYCYPSKREKTQNGGKKKKNINCDNHATIIGNNNTKYIKFTACYCFTKFS